MLIALLALTMTACGPDQPGAPEGPAEEPGGGQADEPADLEGTLGGDAQLEGGCAWLDSDGQRYEVMWPEGYRVEFRPVRLLGPGGEVVAEEGDSVRVSGREAPDMTSVCMVGPIFQATEVLSP